MNEDDVADFLSTHPAFFEKHAELLGRIRLANPHGTRAISLPERQIEMLREKNRLLERRLSELVRYGHENDDYAVKFDRWVTRLLAARDVTMLPEAICDGLREIFDVPMAALRVWGVDSAYADLPAAQAAGAEIERFTDSLGTPYCGANRAQTLRAVEMGETTPSADTGFAAAAWLSERGDAANVESIALIPLRTPDAAPSTHAFGLLAIASSDPARFQKEMATDLLIRIGALAGAALSRLLP